MATTEYPGHFDATSIITAICASLASYNALELILLILTTFQHYHGLYFWSIVVASSSIIPYVVGMVIMYFGTSSQLAGLVVNNIGWITMIVSQSIVLYSRLGIVLGNHSSRILVFTKWMIVVDAIIFYLLATSESILNNPEVSNQFWQQLSLACDILRIQALPKDMSIQKGCK